MEGINLKTESVNNICFAAFEPKNRLHKRQMGFEYMKILARLEPVIDSFMDKLFDELDSTDYLELYHQHLIAYEEISRWIETIMKPKYCKLNEYYFHQLFFPVEKIA